MRWAGHVARMGEERGVYRVLVGKPEGKKPLGRSRRRWVDNIIADSNPNGGAWMSVCCECCVLSGTGLSDVLITRPEESFRLWCVVVCDLETS